MSNLELYEKYKKGEIKYMPSWWQHVPGADKIGEYGDVIFFKIPEHEINGEKLGESIRAADRAGLEFDKRMAAAERQMKRSLAKLTSS